MTYKELMINTIRAHQYYEEGVLEAKSEAEVKDIYEALLDWMEE